MADPTKDCPAEYASKTPVEGVNLGYSIAGQTRDFFLMLPPADFTGPRPLLVAFNGTGGNGKSFSSSSKLSDFAARGFVVVAPSSNENGTIWPVWDAMHTSSEPDVDNKDLAYFDSLVQCLAGHQAIDSKRIYIGGHSAGGIMTNYMLQRRSTLLAGGIVASGVLSLTKPQESAPLDDLFALVTWGGDNDAYSGGTGEVSVPEINFVEQAALASQFYAAEPNVGHVRCSGANIGHAWLDEINTSMIDLLLAHPKGLSGKSGITVAASPGGGVSCSTEPFEFESGVTVICPTQTTTPGCAKACQLWGDCVVENATVGPILAPQLPKLGFSGPDNSDCSGCVSYCETTATTNADAEVLACMSMHADKAECGPGIDGALPAIDAINVCCEGRSDSPLCLEVCATMLENGATKAFLSSCVALADK